MTTSTSIINTIFAGALVLGAAAPASADHVFPPRHLSPDAVFNTGTVSEGAIGDPWYHEGESDRRVSLKENETQTSSPNPSTYYFAKIRIFPPSHLNSESVTGDEYHNLQRDGEIKIADEERVADDKS